MPVEFVRNSTSTLAMNRRIPNGTYGGVRGRGLITRPYSMRRTTESPWNLLDQAPYYTVRGRYEAFLERK